MTPLESAIAVCDAEAEYDVAAAAREELARLREALAELLREAVAMRAQLVRAYQPTSYAQQEAITGAEAALSGERS